MKVHNEVRRPLVRASVSTCFCAAWSLTARPYHNMQCGSVRLLSWVLSVWGSVPLRPDSQLVLLHLNTSAVLIASCLPHEPSGRRTTIMEGVGAAQALLPPFKL